MTQILVFGPSTTYGAWDSQGGWVQRLRRWLDKKVIESDYEKYYLVYNLGIDGDTSDGILKRFERELQPRLEPDEETIILINAGTNDSIVNNSTGEFRCPPETFRTNVEELVRLAQKHTNHVVLVGNKPIDEKRVDPIPWVEGHSYKEEHLKRYEAIVKDVAEKKGVLFIDICGTLKDTDFISRLPDGVHPNDEGHEKIFQIVKRELIAHGILEE